MIYIMLCPNMRYIIGTCYDIDDLERDLSKYVIHSALHDMYR